LNEREPCPPRPPPRPPKPPQPPSRPPTERELYNHLQHKYQCHYHFPHCFTNERLYSARLTFLNARVFGVKSSVFKIVFNFFATLGTCAAQKVDSGSSATLKMGRKSAYFQVHSYVHLAGSGACVRSSLFTVVKGISNYAYLFRF
jgi:hypothetical protein